MPEQGHEQPGHGGILADDGLGDLGADGQERGARVRRRRGRTTRRDGLAAEVPAVDRLVAPTRPAVGPAIGPGVGLGVGLVLGGLGLVGHERRTLSSRSVSAVARVCSSTSVVGGGPVSSAATWAGGIPEATAAAAWTASTA